MKFAMANGGEVSKGLLWRILRVAEEGKGIAESWGIPTAVLGPAIFGPCWAAEPWADRPVSLFLYDSKKFVSLFQLGKRKKDVQYQNRYGN